MLLLLRISCRDGVCADIVHPPRLHNLQVKRLPKIPAPARFGRKLTASQKERATHICVDCGYIYSDRIAFEERDPNYRCPQVRSQSARMA